MTALALTILLALGPAPTSATDNPDFATAVAAWKEQRWPEAADAFARAYEHDPRPEYVFARAQALRFGGDCEAAIGEYRRFVELGPLAAAIAEAREHIATCGGQPDPAPEPTAPAPAPTPTTTTTAPPAPIHTDAPKRVKPWWRDPAGHVLGWPGLAAAAVGTGLAIEADRRRDRADAAIDEQGYRDARRGAPAMMQSGIALVSIGGALVLASVIRFAVVGARARKADRDASRRAHIAPHGLGFAWSP